MKIDGIIASFSFFDRYYEYDIDFWTSIETQFS